jgi:hypothetical protein
MSEAFDGAAHYLKEERLVTGRAGWHADLRLTQAGVAEARRLRPGGQGREVGGRNAKAARLRPER